MTPRPSIHHIGISVTDLDAATDFYTRLLDAEQVGSRETPAWRKTLVGTDGFLMSLTQHAAGVDSVRFDETRPGLDHLGIGCGSREDLDAWLAHVDGLGFERSQVTEAPHAHLFTCRDPDGTPVEFYWPVG